MEPALYQDEFITCTVTQEVAALTYQSTPAAGAIGKAQGESWLEALSCLQSVSLQELRLVLNSAGAHFGEPMEGLFHLNAIAEELWALRNRGVKITVECPGWLYGGMAMVLTSVAHQIVLHPQAHMGLFGPKVLGQTSFEPIPAVKYQPSHLELTRRPLS